MGRCPVCNGHVGEIWGGGDPRGVFFNCGTCGPFFASEHFSSMLRLNHAALMPYLSAHLRQSSTRQDPLVVTADTFLDWIAAHSRTSVPQKRHLVLEHFARMSGSRFGVRIDVGSNDYPLFDFYDAEEMWAVIRSLVVDNLVERDINGDACVLGVRGWSQVAPVGRGVIGRAFVAMAYHPDLMTAWEDGIRPALKVNCGVHPVRLDREHFNDKIDDEMIAEIRQAQFTVSDVTCQAANVYFEAGFAKGLGRPVVWCCRENDIENVHFDARQFHFVRWSTESELRDRLTNRIQATGLAQTVKGLK